MAKYGPKGGVSQAQSGGRDHTFSGGKGGGGVWGHGATAGRKIGNALRNGLRVAIRTETGNQTLRPMKGRAGNPPPVRGNTGGALRKIKIQKPVRGGH